MWKTSLCLIQLGTSQYLMIVSSEKFIWSFRKLPNFSSFFSGEKKLHKCTKMINFCQFDDFSNDFEKKGGVYHMIDRGRRILCDSRELRVFWARPFQNNLQIFFTNWKMIRMSSFTPPKMRQESPKFFNFCISSSISTKKLVLLVENEL